MHHAGGSTDVVLDQRSGGGVWTPLGAFTLDPALAPEVELLGSGGSLSADAVRFVDAASATAAPANVSYVHTDHLGTPRKLTDAAANLVWDHQTTPFGETVALAGLADVNLRFPGQYFDAESGLHYNYFRDYDPSTGRYIESDPIGLAGGINTYGYVGGNPVNRVDPEGLQTEAALLSCTFGGLANPISDAAIILNVCKWALTGASAIAAGTLLSSAACGEESGDECSKVDDDDCDKEWDDAYKMCNQLIGKDTSRGITGGYTNLDECARGLVS